MDTKVAMLVWPNFHIWFNFGNCPWRSSNYWPRLQPPSLNHETHIYQTANQSIVC